MNRQNTTPLIEIALLFALLITGIMLAAWSCLRPDPVSMLSNVTMIICTPSRCAAIPRPELPEWPFDDPPESSESSDYVQEIGPQALLRVPEAAELQPEPVAGAVETSK